MDSKQTSSLVTSICSFIFGDQVADAMTMHEQITFFMQNGAFAVSMAAGFITIYYTIKKHLKNNKNG
jgi:hypothetical protein